MARYLAIWSTVIEDCPTPLKSAIEALKLIRDPDYTDLSFHVREVMDSTDEEGAHDLGEVVEVTL